jgi:hypothetical protein
MTNKNNKQRLFEIMKKVDPSFTLKLNENMTVDNFYLSDDVLNKILKGYLEAALWTEEENLKDSVELYNDVTTNDYNDEDDESQEEIRFMEIMRNKLNTNPIISFTSENIDPNSLIQAYLDIKNFINNAGGAAIIEALNNNDEFQLGMDIWLSRNRHGSGFFDRSYENEDSLMNAAHNLKEVDFYVGDDNKLYFSNAH